MLYCPNCGNQVKPEHYYCSQCGDALADIDDDSDAIPQSSSAATQQGFLSGRSKEYLVALHRDEKELDRDSVGYANLTQDVGAGLADFAKVELMSETTLFDVMLMDQSGDGILKKNRQQLSHTEVQKRLMWEGIMSVPKLYDKTFDTEWADELSDRLEALVAEIEESTVANE